MCSLFNYNASFLKSPVYLKAPSTCFGLLPTETWDSFLRSFLVIRIAKNQIIVNKSINRANMLGAISQSQDSFLFLLQDYFIFGLFKGFLELISSHRQIKAIVNIYRFFLHSFYLLLSFFLFIFLWIYLFFSFLVFFDSL